MARAVKMATNSQNVTWTHLRCQCVKLPQWLALDPGSPMAAGPVSATIHPAWEAMYASGMVKRAIRRNHFFASEDYFVN